jgi:hypothetical protein
VITIAWCLGLMNSSSSSRLTTVLVAMFLATRQPYPHGFWYGTRGANSCHCARVTDAPV